MRTISADDAHMNIKTILNEVITSLEPILITAENGNAILVNEDNWKDLEETITLLSSPEMKDSIKNGRD